jgi:hypothetical protein
MKYLLLFLLVAYTCSCSSPSSIKVEGTGADTIVRFKTLDTTVYFSGIWVNEQYVNSVKGSLSPRQAYVRENIEKSCIVIPGKTLQVTRLIAWFHEGGGDVVVVRDGERYQFYAADLTGKSSDIEILSPTRIRMFDAYFTKLENTDATLFNLGILEEMLFSGHYQLPGGEEVIFGKDGTVSGLDSFTHYTPLLDYAEDEGKVDLLVLKGKQEHDFGFRFTQDSLFIYAVTCVNKDPDRNICYANVLADKVYTLSRIRR